MDERAACRHGHVGQGGFCLKLKLGPIERELKSVRLFQQKIRRTLREKKGGRKAAVKCLGEKQEKTKGLRAFFSFLFFFFGWGWCTEREREREGLGWVCEIGGKVRSCIRKGKAALGV